MKPTPMLLLQSAGGEARAGGLGKLPPLQKADLPNGLRVIVVESHDLPTVAINLTIKSGSGANPPERPDLAGMTAEMVLLGSPSRSAEQIAEEVDSLGATLTSISTWDCSSLTSTALSSDTGRMLDFLSDLAQNASFPRKELDLLKQRRLNELKTKLDNPSIVANERFAEVLFPEHPYGHPPDGTAASVPATTREDLTAFHASHYTAGNAILIIVGDVPPAKIIDRVRIAFEKWQKGKPSLAGPEAPVSPRETRIVLVDRSDLTQTQIRMGHLGIARNNPDWFPLQVANYILGGGGFSSRLLDRIRVQKGYTYGLNSSFSARMLPGPFVISTFTPHETVPEVIEESILVEREFQERGPEPRELEEAKNFFVSGYPRSFETPAGIASALLEVELYGLGDRHIETYQNRMAAVTADQVRRVARQYFDTKRLAIVCVTKADEVRERLEKLNRTGIFGEPGRVEVSAFF